MTSLSANWVACFGTRPSESLLGPSPLLAATSSRVQPGVVEDAQALLTLTVAFEAPREEGGGR